MALLSIVVPCYNEEAVIEETFRRITSILPDLGMEAELIFINDGSSDQTMNILSRLADQNSNTKVLSFSRNFGHQRAITAGMDYAVGDAIVIIDADLQDPVDVIHTMVEKWREGFDVVYGKRIDRKGESVFKRASASLFYKILDKLSEEKIPTDVGDFRLIDRKVCDALKKMPEHSRYVRGLIAWLGYKTTFVEFVREPRYAGKTKYSFAKMLKLASDGVFSFSYKPLKIASLLGVIVSILSFLYLVYVVYLGLFSDNTVWGWSSLMAVLLFLCGIILSVLGIIGEYIARIYEEVKARPIYVIDRSIGFVENDITRSANRVTETKTKDTQANG
jgi:dolichol-phosphate mannosyltransferase